MELSLIFIGFGLIIGVILAGVPRLSIFVLSLLSVVVVGITAYFFPQIGTIRWAVTLISVVILIRAILDAFLKEKPTGSIPRYMWVMLLLLFHCSLTTSLNLNLKETIISSKNYFQFWSIPLAMYFSIKKDSTVNLLVKTLLIIAIIQTPVAILQYLFFTQKSGMFPGDSVAGTFGGQVSGGGPNAALSIFMVIQIGFVICSGLNKIVSWPKVYLLIFWLSIPIILCNAKAILVFFVILIIMIFSKELFRRPLLAFTGIILMGIIVSGTSYMHYKEAWRYSPQKYQPENIEEYFERTLNYNIRTDSDKISRLEAILFWYYENKKDPLRIVFGHGLGASKVRGIIRGHVANRHQYRHLVLGPTALSRFLWDIGILGTSLFLLIFISGAFAARKIKNNRYLEPIHQAHMRIAEIACIFFVLSVPYKLSIIFIQSFSFLSMFYLGYIAYWYSYIKVMDADKRLKEIYAKNY